MKKNLLPVAKKESPLVLFPQFPPFKSLLCDSKFNHRSSRTRHVHKCHPNAKEDSPAKCYLCDEKFPSVRAAANHFPVHRVNMKNINSYKQLKAQFEKVKNDPHMPSPKSHWTQAEMDLLIVALKKHGIQSTVKVANELKNKTSKEVSDHLQIYKDQFKSKFDTIPRKDKFVEFITAEIHKPTQPHSSILISNEADKQPTTSTISNAPLIPPQSSTSKTTKPIKRSHISYYNIPSSTSYQTLSKKHQNSTIEAKDDEDSSDEFSDDDDDEIEKKI